MARYIDADKIEITVSRGINDDGLIFIPMKDVHASIDRTPTAEVVPMNEVAQEFTCFVGDPHKVDHCPYLDEIEKAKTDVAREIFERLHAHISFDGHTFSVWKNDLICVAKEYGVDLVKFEADLRNFRLQPKKYTEEKE